MVHSSLVLLTMLCKRDVQLCCLYVSQVVRAPSYLCVCQSVNCLLAGCSALLFVCVPSCPCPQLFVCLSKCQLSVGWLLSFSVCVSQVVRAPSYLCVPRQLCVCLSKSTVCWLAAQLCCVCVSQVVRAPSYLCVPHQLCVCLSKSTVCWLAAQLWCVCVSQVVRAPSYLCVCQSVNCLLAGSSALSFVRVYPGEPVPKETVTPRTTLLLINHSYQLPPSTTNHSINFAQSTYLAFSLHNL